MADKPQPGPWLVAPRWETKAQGRQWSWTCANRNRETPKQPDLVLLLPWLSLSLSPPFQTNMTFRDQMGQQVPTIPRALLSSPSTRGATSGKISVPKQTAFRDYPLVLSPGAQRASWGLWYTAACEEFVGHMSVT